MAKTVFNGDMVFHVWAQATQSEGKRSDGRVFFEGATIFSYGHHFALGYLWELGATGSYVALLNTDGYSVSTSKHKGQTRSAVAHMRILYFPELTELARLLTGLRNPYNQDARKRFAAQIAAYLEKHALTINHASGEWLLGLIKPRASFAKMVETAKHKAAIADRAAKKVERDNLARRAAHYAKMTDSQWLENVGEYTMRMGGKSALVMATDVAKCLKAAKLAPTLSARLDARIKALRKEGKRMAAIQERGERLATFATAKATLRGVLGAKRDIPANSLKARIAANAVASLDQTQTGTARDAIREMFRALNQWRGNNSRRTITATSYTRPAAILERLDELLRDRRAVLVDIAEREEQAKQAAKLSDWLAGRGTRWDRFSDRHGFAYVRAVGVERDERGRINGGTLETSHGADVPLVDAVKVYRMVKLVRERGEGWKRNGTVLPVGSFNVDSISPEGNFQAGCHRFAWEEIARLAASLGLADIDADNTTIRA